MMPSLKQGSGTWVQCVQKVVEQSTQDWSDRSTRSEHDIMTLVTHETHEKSILQRTLWEWPSQDGIRFGCHSVTWCNMWISDIFQWIDTSLQRLSALFVFVTVAPPRGFAQPGSDLGDAWKPNHHLWLGRLSVESVFMTRDAIVGFTRSFWVEYIFGSFFKSCRCSNLSTLAVFAWWIWMIDAVSMGASHSWK